MSCSWAQYYCSVLSLLRPSSPSLFWLTLKTPFWSNLCPPRPRSPFLLPPYFLKGPSWFPPYPLLPPYPAGTCSFTADPFNIYAPTLLEFTMSPLFPSSSASLFWPPFFTGPSGYLSCLFPLPPPPKFPKEPLIRCLWSPSRANAFGETPVLSHLSRPFFFVFFLPFTFSWSFFARL